jgi:hypothetical protein
LRAGVQGAADRVFSERHFAAFVVTLNLVV